MFDAVTLLLAVLLLVPAKRFPAFIDASLRRRWIWPAVALCAPALSMLVPVPFVLTMTVVFCAVSFYAFLEFTAQWSRDGHPRRRQVAWVVAGLVMSIRVVSGPQVAAEGTAYFWILDAVNKLFFVTVGLLLRSLQMEEAVPFVLGYMTETLVFVTTYFTALVFVGNLVLLALIYELMRLKAPLLPSRLPQLTGRLPRPATILMLILSLPVMHAFMERGPLAFIAQALRAVHCLAGLWLLWQLTVGRPFARTLYWPGLLVATLHPALFWIPVAVAAANAFVDLDGWLRRHVISVHLVRIRLAELLSVGRGLMRPLPILGTFLFLQVPSNALELPLGLGEPTTPRVAATDDVGPTSREDVVRVKVDPDTSFGMDRYEFPNEAGQLPMTGLPPGEAERMCEQRGGHLCTRDEWTWACSEGGRFRFILGSELSDETLDRVRSSCNLMTKGLVPSGSSPDCHNGIGLYDLTGNAYEWVRLEGRDDLYGLLGAYYGMADDWTISCDFVIVVAETQVAVVDLDAVGFRCCEG